MQRESDTRATSVAGLGGGKSGRVGQVPIAHFVGHKVGTLAGDTYSAGGAKENALKTAEKISFGEKLERAARALAGVSG